MDGVDIYLHIHTPHTHTTHAPPPPSPPPPPRSVLSAEFCILSLGSYLLVLPCQYNLSDELNRNLTSHN